MGCPMKRTRQLNAAPRAARTAETEDSAALIESLTLESLDRLVGLLARNGVAQPLLEHAFQLACQKYARRRRPARSASLAAQYTASLVLAAWYTDLDYLDREGRPLHLPLNGSEPSLRSLIQRLGLTIPARDMVGHLERLHAVRQVGRAYAPCRRVKPLLGTGGLAGREMLRLVVRLLRSLDENRAQHRAGNLDEIKVVTALESTELPVRSRSLFKAQLTRDIQQFGSEVESRMLRHERTRVSGEPLMRVGIGVFHFEEASPEPAPRARGRKRAPRTASAAGRRRAD